jgi:hypothetical protein
VAIRFYIDADLLGMANVLVMVRADVTYPGDPGGTGIEGRPRPPCPIEPRTKDAQSIPIPQVASNGWVVITRDRHMQHRPDEKVALVSAGGRHVTLDAAKQLDRWGQLEIVVTQWRAIERMIELPGPWIYSASRSGVRKVL